VLLTPALRLGLINPPPMRGFSHKNFIIFYIGLFLFITSNQSIFSQTLHFDSLVITGIKQIYSINFNDAEVTFRKLMADYPNHPAGRFFIAMIDWWKVLLDLDVETYDEKFYQKIEDVIYNC
jgi:hypothetical protein